MLARTIVSIAGILLILGVNWYFLEDLFRRPPERFDRPKF